MTKENKKEELIDLSPEASDIRAMELLPNSEEEDTCLICKGTTALYRMISTKGIFCKPCVINHQLGNLPEPKKTKKG
jgi:hypothetical protein